MKIYGLLGKNINYSLSPLIHKAAFDKLGIKAEYRLFDIDEGGLGVFFESMHMGEVAGCNVTIPYKEKALKYIDKSDNLVRSIGAINTVVKRDDHLEGYNTDCEGFLRSLTGDAPGDLCFDPQGKSVFIFGAGGAAKSIIFGFLTVGVKKIIIADIDRKKAESLAMDVVEKQKGNTIISVAEDETQYNEFISKSELLVNATPCGMKSGDRPLFDYSYMHERLYVFDLIYSVKTQLIKEAEARSARVINGINMLLYQAAASFRHWTGQNAPIDAMRETIKGKIK